MKVESWLMLAYLKKNWLNILMAIIAALGSADAVAGMRDGKSATNVTVIPGILAAIGASGTLGVRWLNSRTVVARGMRVGLPPDLLDRIENLYSLARDPDVTPDHASHLADMAGDMLLAENRRAKAEWLEANRPVQVSTWAPASKSVSQSALELAAIIREAMSKSPMPIHSPAEQAAQAKPAKQESTPSQEVAR